LILAGWLHGARGDPAPAFVTAEFGTLMKHSSPFFSPGMGLASNPGMKSQCAWCYPKANRFAAQRVERHALSHGMCEWHVVFSLAKLAAFDRKAGEPKNKRKKI